MDKPKNTQVIGVASGKGGVGIICASTSPTKAQRKEPPPSTTSTRPSPGFANSALTNTLSSNTLTVCTEPLSCERPPKWANIGSSTDTSLSWASQRSAVEMLDITAFIKVETRVANSAWHSFDRQDGAANPSNRQSMYFMSYIRPDARR
jgi:hypothetical protein